MESLAKISEKIDQLLAGIGKVAAWAGVVLIGVTIFDIITRRFLVLGSTKIQEFEWHMHVVLFGLLIGYAYLKDTHVRIDLVRERLGERTQWWLEIIGCLIFLLPYCALVIYFSYDFTVRAFTSDEISASATGLSHRWIIKAIIPIGFSLLALAGLATIFRKVVELFGPPELSMKVHEIEEAEAARLVEAQIKRKGGA
ncbi:MAG TPA: TRAP transporter small permease subunit [Kiloniellales bacterium]|jgi:TRAP-type mannitol/chloroaromatic compound transport system permease small subunit